MMTQICNFTGIMVVWMISAIVADQSALSRRERKRYKRGWMTGTKSPGTPCTFDPCKIPNFCGGGRKCELDDSCQYQCLCTDQSTHESCVKSSTSTSTFKPDVTVSKLTTVLTATTITCVFNPCSVPNFCGDGRRCELDKTCKHTCVCLDDFTHENCKPVTISPHLTITPSVTCAFNPCSTPNYNFCGEGRRCEFDRKTCKHNCVCLDNVTHDNCKTDVPTTTESPDDDTGRNCPAGFPCKHGYCELPDIECICDDGWGGTFCDKQSFKCTKECDEGTKCLLLPDFTEVCVKTKPDMNTTDPDVEDKTNACSSQYRFRNESERTCKYGMLCYYGVCVDTGHSSSCECDTGASGTLCSTKCCRDCGANGDCFLDDDGNELCNCHYNYTGSDCSILKPPERPPEKVTWYLWIVGACAVLLVVLLVLLLVVPYMMWKHRVILVMKIVHYFQKYEDNDDREWDVFVSYKATGKDESFVVHTLYPKLEQELGFKLNMHFRDFIPGDTIANNIIRAVQGSRRTILLITPSFVKSEFTRFEYQVAQQEMLKRKHRIIPVLLDDISECESTMDPNLKTILSSVTYLEWPSDCSNEKKVEKFWKRLQLSLPKKRPSSDTNKSSQSDIFSISDIKLSVQPMKDSLTNGAIHSNPVYYSEPEADYDTINEAELDMYRNMKNKQENTVDLEKNEERYVKILDQISN